MQLGILKRLRYGMMIFGIAMGAIFPLYAILFVNFKPGMQIWFNIGCIIAGIMVGGFSYMLVKIILLGHLRKLAWACREVTSGRLDVNIDLNSPDEVGEIVTGFNMMISTLQEMFAEIKSGVKDLGSVAGEVKELATRTSKATQEIESMLSAFQVNVDQIIKGVKVNAELNIMLDEMLGSSTKNVNEIIQSIEKVSKMIEQVSEATRQQVEAYHNIDVSMGSISQAFSDLLESTNYLVQNGDDILRFTSHLHNITKRFTMTEQLELNT